MIFQLLSTIGTTIKDPRIRRQTSTSWIHSQTTRRKSNIQSYYAYLDYCCWYFIFEKLNQLRKAESDNVDLQEKLGIWELFPLYATSTLISNRLIHLFLLSLFTPKDGERSKMRADIDEAIETATHESERIQRRYILLCNSMCMIPML